MTLLWATLVASGVGLLREVVVASSLGLGSALDALVTSVAFAALLSSSLVSASTSSVTPLVARHSAGEEMRCRLAGALVLTSIAVGMVAASILWLARSWLAEVLWAGRSSGTGGGFAAIVLVAALFGCLRGTSTAWLNANERFLPPALVPAAGSATVIAFVLFSDEPTGSSLAACFAVSIGLESLILFASQSAQTRPSFPDVAALRLVWGAGAGWSTSLLGAIIFGLNPIIDLAVANGLEDGSAARLAVASRVPLAVAALSAVVLVTPAFTRMSQLAAERPTHVVDAARVELRRIGSLLIPVSVALGTVGTVAARLVYARGELSTGDAWNIGVTQSVVSLAILPYVGGVLMSRALMSLGRFRNVLAAAVIGASANVVLDFALGATIGVNGIALATALVYSLTMWMMWRSMARVAGPKD